MGNDKLTKIRDYIVKNSKFLFPVILIVVVAVTVSIALGAGRKEGEESVPQDIPEATQVSGEGTEAVEPSESQPEESGPQEIPLVANEDEAIYGLVTQYYNAMLSGDSASMAAVYDEISENDLLRYEETAKYLDQIPAVDVYTKPGLVEGTTVVYVSYRLCFVNHEEQVPGWNTFYVCRRDDGSLYIKNEANFTEEEKDYIKAVSGQADVVEVNNRVTVEYNDLVTEHPELLSYMGELGKQVNAMIGVRLAEVNTGSEGGEAPEANPEGGEAPAENPEGGEAPAENPEGGEAPAENPEGGEAPAENPEGGETPAEDPEGGEVPGANPEGGEGAAPTENPEGNAPAEMGPRYATATTTVNVRSSDSEQADKVGKVPGGTKVQVQEVKVNGWSKIVFEGGDGYIKSEYLHMEESADGQTVIGTVTANENVKIRSAASETADQLGLMVGGDSLELLANENGWCKVIYDGKIGYVKADYVTQQ